MALENELEGAHVWHAYKRAPKRRQIVTMAVREQRQTGQLHESMGSKDAPEPVPTSRLWPLIVSAELEFTMLRHSGDRRDQLPQLPRSPSFLGHTLAAMRVARMHAGEVQRRQQGTAHTVRRHRVSRKEFQMLCKACSTCLSKCGACVRCEYSR